MNGKRPTLNSELSVTTFVHSPYSYLPSYSESSNAYGQPSENVLQTMPPPPFINSLQHPPPSPSPSYFVSSNYTTVPSTIIAKMEKSSVTTNCLECRVLIQTNVRQKVSGGGLAWAIICCCFGSFPLSFLVLCLDCFNEWYHHCPICNKLLGRYAPSVSGQTCSLLVFATLGIITLQIIFLRFYFIPLFTD